MSKQWGDRSRAADKPAAREAARAEYTDSDVDKAIGRLVRLGGKLTPERVQRAMGRDLTAKERGRIRARVTKYNQGKSP